MKPKKNSFICRQRKLEEGLLFTGQFNEALQALLDWLAKMEPALADDTPVHGDLETVNGFLESHKVNHTLRTLWKGTFESSLRVR